MNREIIADKLPENSNLEETASEEGTFVESPLEKEKAGSSAGKHAEVPLGDVLKSTLEDLNQSIGHMEAIVSRLEAGDTDWKESVRLISEANELAIACSRKLDRAVQDVVYGSPGREDEEEGEGESGQRTLDLS
ncbi:MAG: exodeoxyribonuclease VII small subunit [Thermoleophilia bacterium]|nr:exodeoxyribonuclease VII small subunit [Thermoleophilia bacterium]